jgi:hypothetical protein
LTKPILGNAEYEGDKAQNNIVSLDLWTPTNTLEGDREPGLKMNWGGTYTKKPGMKKEDVRLQLENGVLTISGEKKFENETKDKAWHRMERRYGSIFRSITLPLLLPAVVSAYLIAFTTSFDEYAVASLRIHVFC